MGLWDTEEKSKVQEWGWHGNSGTTGLSWKRTVRGWMDVAQAEPSFLGNAVVPPGLSSPWAACSMRMHCGQRGKATTSMGLLPEGRPAARLWAHRAPKPLWLLHTSSVTGNKQCAPDVSLSPCLISRATWAQCCQPVLAHRSIVTLTTPTKAV